jgi:diguanylate cyclase (GGDEF)-like protein
MAARLRLPALLLLCLLATGVLALVLWRTEQDEVRAEARERAGGVAAALEERTDAAILALQGVRAGYDAAPDSFGSFARVPLARPEIVAVGWAPRVPASERRSLEADEQIRIGAPAGADVTYPLLHQEPAPPTPDALDLGSDPSLGEALLLARTNAEPRLSAPVRLERDGRLGVFAFVPVFARDLPTRTPGERRDALRGVVAGALAADELVRAALTNLPPGLGVRVTDGRTVLANGPGGSTVARAHLGGRTWRVSLAPAAPSPLAPLGIAAAGLALAALVLVATLRLRRAASRLGEEQQARRLVVDASDALVLELDPDGIIRGCSAASFDVLGYEPWEVIGTEVYALLHPDDLVSRPGGPQRYLHRNGNYVALDARRLSHRDDRGFVVGVVTVLRPVAASDRTTEHRLRDAVALEPDPVELFAVVAEEVALDLSVPTVAVVRFETGGFGTIAGAHEPSDSAELVPGSPVSLEGDEPAACVFRTGDAVPGAAPIRIGGRLWGALVAGGAGQARLLELAVAAQPAIAFAGASAQLGALATRDALTNLADGRAFHEQLRAETRRAQRHGRALSLVLINLDGFRRINGEHGRLAGDRVLAEVGRRLAATVRNGELVARLGADHFGWILPETGGLNGWIAAERARRAVAATSIDGVGAVTASAGVCDLEDVSDADELLARTEVALVHAKTSGGNATFRYSLELDGNDTELEPETDRGLGRLRALALELDAEDPGTEGHSERVARLSEKLALSSGWSPARAVRLAQAALVHDVGKLGIDESVLRKAGPLSEQELEQIRNHPDTGAELAVNALDEEQLSWIRYHHERWDGGGYPSGIAGELIPVGARLLALAEAWDSMTSSRVYGEALGAAEALAECKRERAAQFAPEAVDALERLWALGALHVADAGAVSVD